MARGGEALNGFVDSGCVIRGELEFKTYFRVDGRVEGTVRSGAELVVGESGVIEGELEVADLLRGAVRFDDAQIEKLREQGVVD